MLDSERIEVLSEYLNYKNKCVSNACKSIINLYREVNPSVLSKKLRGRVFKGISQGESIASAGDVRDKVEGVEFLRMEEGGLVDSERFLT